MAHPLGQDSRFAVLRFQFPIFALAVALAACSTAGPSEEATTGRSTRPGRAAKSVTSSRVDGAEKDGGQEAPWGAVIEDDELVVFVGTDRRSVVVGTLDGHIAGAVDFDSEVVVAPFPADDRVVVQDEAGSTAWILDTSTGLVVEEISGTGGRNDVHSGDRNYLAEVGDGDVDGEGWVAIRDALTDDQLSYVSVEPGWVHEDGGAIFASSSNLVALPTFSPSSDEHALMIMDAATGDVVGFTGPDNNDFLGWVSPSCWLSATTESLVVHCLAGGSIDTVAQVDAAALPDQDLADFDSQQMSIDDAGRIVLSIPSRFDALDRRLTIVSGTGESVEIHPGSLPRWSTYGNAIAATLPDQVVVLDVTGEVLSMYDGAPAAPVFTASATVDR